MALVAGRLCRTQASTVSKWEVGGGRSVRHGAGRCGQPRQLDQNRQAGPFSVANLATGQYELYADPTCGGTATSPYATEYPEADPGLSSPTKLTLSQNTSGADFALADHY